jgi:hypothetical protein
MTTTEYSFEIRQAVMWDRETDEVLVRETKVGMFAIWQNRETGVWIASLDRKTFARTDTRDEAVSLAETTYVNLDVARRANVHGPPCPHGGCPDCD